MAPDFSLKDLNGHPVSLTALRGHPVLLDFWATWCGPCRISIPEVDAFYQRHQSEGLRVVGIDMDDDPSDVYGFVKQYRMSYPVVLGANSPVAGNFGVEGLPTFVLIDPNGKVVQRIEGFSEDLVSMWEAELAKMNQKS